MALGKVVLRLPDGALVAIEDRNSDRGTTGPTVGAGRSVFTGRSVFRSGLDMFVVGLGVAVVGYFVGDWIARVL
jgi:hypothetical protein